MATSLLGQVTFYSSYTAHDVLGKMPGRGVDLESTMLIIYTCVKN